MCPAQPLQRPGASTTWGRSSGIFATARRSATAFSTSALNNAGQIVGFFTSLSFSHGFLDTNGSFTQIDVPGATSTQVWGINNAGQIVGSYSAMGDGHHGFIDTNGSFTQIDVPLPGTIITDTFGINDSGQHVGSFGSLAPGINGYIDTNGSFTQINVPFVGATGTQVFDINDAGQIVGLFQLPDVHNMGLPHAFIADPVPEPASLILLGSGILTLGSFRMIRPRKRRWHRAT
jgi:uncharacterized membrane protein